MSDSITKALADFASRVDTIGCLLSGINEDASLAVRTLALRYPKADGATIIGFGTKTTMEMATFSNGTAIRYLDFNDTYLSVEPQHPSDVIAPLLALGCM